jgi:regulator of RNase E activity RraB
MGIFNFLKPKKSSNRFVTEEAFTANLNKQAKWTSTTLKQLRNLNVTSDKLLKLEFFFYTNTIEKATALASELNSFSYEVNYGISASNNKEYIVTGWTTKITMTDDTVIEWVNQMCALGYKHDCDFDGWGTTP